MGVELIKKYFPDLSEMQISQFEKSFSIYEEWNQKINVISRKDMDHFFEHHILHSLSIAKFTQFKDGTKIMDLGCGGGFPAIPLAILYPECRFHLVDSIGKKLKVVEAVKEALELKNIFTFHCRAEEMKFQYDFVISRAVASLADLLKWTKGKYLDKDINRLKNGLICLKGGDLKEELSVAGHAKSALIQQYFDMPYFADKSIVYVQR